MAKMPFGEFVRKIGKIRACIQQADADTLEQQLPAWLAQVRSLCEAAGLHNPAVENFVIDLVGACDSRARFDESAPDELA